MATGLSISLKPSSNSKNTRDRNTVLDIQQQGPKRDGGDAWTCVGLGDVWGGGSQQEVEVGQQGVHVRQGSSPEGEGGELREEVLQGGGGGGDKGGDGSEDT